MEIIVAVDAHWGIGYNNDLLIHIPNDLKNFKNLTTNNVIVYGRKTLESFKNSNPLPNRTNIIISRNKKLLIENVVVANSLEELFKLVKEKEKKGEKVYVIGGELIYEQLIDYCSGAYITKIFDTFLANKHFPNIDKKENWEINEKILQETAYIKEVNKEVEYAILHYINKTPKSF